MTLPDRISELNWAYGRGAMLRLFGDHQEFKPQIRWSTGPQLTDQLKQGMADAGNIAVAPDA